MVKYDQGFYVLPNDRTKDVKYFEPYDQEMKADGTLSLQETTCNWPSDLIEVVEFRGTKLALQNNGNVVVLNTDGSRTPYGPLSNERFSIMKRIDLTPDFIK